MISVLGVDLGTKAGWGLRDASGKWFAGLINSQPSRFDSNAIRYIRFERALLELIDVHHPQRVFFEKVPMSHAGTIAAHVYGGYLSTLQMVCEKNQIIYEGVSIQAIKSHATGTARASKEMMLRAAQLKWPKIKLATHDVADALHIADLGTTLC